ncbi:thiamine phosphate synthase [Natronoflexus pectinivorans]|uniref:Thiamine-phosphate pyrophosphorylase n=1 Tax=Natronoflexus pectinivorans TaxID=682526 RepID=A0A4V2RWA6_9BACT|nr:thiamine phosphate synthase [Natronoflexus pectinivorans]TCO07475.1 thiamine-phosphate pyrophosphorylase [Natronoflexus pectinivorans]
MLIVITHPSILRNEAAAITALLNSGACYIHIRKPGASDEEVFRLMQSIPEKYYSKLTMHYHFNVALKLGLGGLHNSSHFKAPQVAGVRQSAGCHSLEEVFVNDRKSLDYMFLSPVFNSISKVGYCSAFSREELIAFFQERGGQQAPVIALGGISMDNVAEIKSMGFSGAALLGSVWRLNGLVADVKATAENFTNAYHIWKQ